MRGRSEGSAAVSDGGAGVTFDPALHRTVELSVYDKQLDELRIFTCDMQLLESTMAYFSPIVRRHLEEEEREARRKGRADEAQSDLLPGGGSSAAPHAGKEKNQAERASSKHKQKECNGVIPLYVNCDLSIFSWLMAYISGKHPSFTPENAVSLLLSSSFLQMTQLAEMALVYIKDNLVEVMLSGVNMESLTGEHLARLASLLTEGDVARAFLKLFDWRAEELHNRRFLTTLLRHMLFVRFGERSASSLRWCSLCGILLDLQELQRVERRCRNVKQTMCPRLTKNSIGVHGELLNTHVASSQPAELAFPTLSWGDRMVEAWAWRVVGSLYFFACRHCGEYVLLANTVIHRCPGGKANFVRVDGSKNEDADALLTWFYFARDLYPDGLLPMYSPREDVPREPLLVLSPSGEWMCEEEEETAVPGLWTTYPGCVEVSVSSRGVVNVDDQNGFERWLMEELQQVMEGFEQCSQTPVDRNGGCGSVQCGAVHTMPPSPSAPATSYGVTRTVSARGADCARGRPPLRSRCSMDLRLKAFGREADTTIKSKDAQPCSATQRRTKAEPPVKAQSQDGRGSSTVNPAHNRELSPYQASNIGMNNFASTLSARPRGTPRPMR
ncbi:hypothetical protein TRVL_05502 [Trypanosoma vivax]|nr:hypothetical protein TRVL_05502 [Trypanosoma vivax]